MRLEVFRRLEMLDGQFALQYGKLVQKLLAIAFCAAGAERVTERGTQGIDLEITRAGGSRLALEVKTTKSKVVFADKDLAGLGARAAEGFAPYFAVLGPGLLDEWVFAHYCLGEIRSGAAYSPIQLRPYRDPELEGWVRDFFDQAVIEHAAVAMGEGQSGLDLVLRGYPVFAIA